MVGSGKNFFGVLGSRLSEARARRVPGARLRLTCALTRSLSAAHVARFQNTSGHMCHLESGIMGIPLNDGRRGVGVEKRAH